MWLERLAADHENLRATLAYLREEGQAGQALSLAGALWRFWEVRGHFAEGRAQLAELLEQAGASVSAPERAKALLGAGAMAYYQGDYAWAGARYAEALDLFRGLDDRAGVAWTLIYQGWLANDRGDFTAARALLGESLAIARALGDRQAIGWSLARLAMTALFQGDYATARGYLDEGVPISASSATSSGWPGRSTSWVSCSCSWVISTPPRRPRKRASSSATSWAIAATWVTPSPCSPSCTSSGARRLRRDH